MTIITQNGCEMVNLERFYSVEARGLQIIATFDLNSAKFYELGRYKTWDRVYEVFIDLSEAMRHSETTYEMPKE